MTKSGIHMLYDTVVNGEHRKVVSHFGRNGFFYSLAAITGSFIKGGQYVNEFFELDQGSSKTRQARRIRSEP